MHDMAKLSARERQQIIDDFVDQAFAGIGTDAPGAHIAQAMRRLPADLPDEPSAELRDAWTELGRLVGDDAFRQRVRQMALGGSEGGEQPPYDPQPVLEHAGAAVEAGVDPASPQGKEILDRIVSPDVPPGERARLADQMETFSDRRVERYWQLMGVLNGRAAFPSSTPAFEWFITALRTHH
ncbi:hypothetical protein [Sphaerisporangium perillae]|uniref:hypothetical protein n=1 Tax=Sphaerisporangium perillae TaxID=2935860 RepID=UPI00200CFCCD|nr:hypothetical protein [Sphaerisporangium perillae]